MTRRSSFPGCCVMLGFLPAASSSAQTIDLKVELRNCEQPTVPPECKYPMVFQPVAPNQELCADITLLPSETIFPVQMVLINVSRSTGLDFPHPPDPGFEWDPILFALEPNGEPSYRLFDVELEGPTFGYNRYFSARYKYLYPFFPSLPASAVPPISLMPGVGKIGTVQFTYLEDGHLDICHAGEASPDITVVTGGITEEYPEIYAFLLSDDVGMVRRIEPDNCIQPVEALAIVDRSHPHFFDTSIPIATRLAAKAEVNPSCEPWHNMSCKPRLVEGLAADGVTKVLIRLGGQGEGRFRIAVKDENGSMLPEHVGELRNAIEAEQRGNPLLLDTVWVPEENTYMLFADLIAPLDFNRTEADHALAERTLTIEIGLPGLDPCITKEIKLVRPPVVLVHGIWGNPCWEWPLAFQGPVCELKWCPNPPTTGGLVPFPGEFLVYPYNYGMKCESSGPNSEQQCVDQSARSFRENIQQPRLAATAARQLLREQKNCTSVQVDYVAHSMGGILGRLWASTAKYRRNENFLGGDFHKFISVDAPQFGSRLAPVLVTPGNRRTFCGWLFELFKPEFQVDHGAVRDLSPNSTELCSLPAVDVPLHVLYGGNPCTPPDPRWLLPIICTPFRTLDAIFGEDHDTIVEVSSQRAGLSFPFLTGFQEQYHDMAKHRHDYNDAVLLLLRERIGEGRFAPGFGPRSCIFASAEPMRIRDQDPMRSLVITSPATGTPVTPGSQLTVTVESIEGFQPSALLVVGKDSAVLVETSPWEARLDIPHDAIGSFSIQAFGRNEAEEFAVSDEVVLQVIVAQSPSSLLIYPSPIFLSAFAPNQGLKVLATYPDGVTRDVTRSSIGTAYSTDDPAIAAVTDGVLIAKSPGETLLRATNGGIEQSTRVIVLGIPNDWNNNGHYDLGDHGAFVGCISGPVPAETSDARCGDFFDANNDLVIDLRDFAEFQRRFDGPSP